MLQKLKFIFIHIDSFYKKKIINKYEFYSIKFVFFIQLSLINDIENTYHEMLKLKIPLRLKTNVKNNEISKHTIKRKISDFLEI